MVQKEYYPSQKRYYANNPTVSFRLPKELKEKLEKLAERGGMTKGQYVRDFLEGVVTEREKEDKIYADGFKDGQKEGLEEGYKKGREDWQIGLNCSVCGKQGYIKPQSELHKLILEERIVFLKKECLSQSGLHKMLLEGVPTISWGHEDCRTKNENRIFLLPR
ncbi:MAG TPA: ribbon-helix-helix protein, CopG family [Thermoplasmata archaeon]|nr:ribbon-helix-helix protein, CopG family [Thermoplasmata archaeon]